MNKEDTDLDEIKQKLARIDTTITHIATASEKDRESFSKKLDKFDERLRLAETDISSKSAKIQTIEKWEEDITKLDGRLKVLENWKWFIMGGIVILGAAIYYFSNMILGVLRSGVLK